MKTKKKRLTELKDSRPVEIERVSNGYILMSGYRHEPTPAERLVFNNLEDLFDELEERFE